MASDSNGLPTTPFVLDAQAQREAHFGIPCREALDAVRDLQGTGGPTGKADPALEGLSVEELNERLKAQTTDSQTYWDEHGLSPEGHIER